jgi:Xaa-Pro aminopeptidase
MDDDGAQIMNALDKITAVRGEMTRLGLDGFLVPRADEHLAESVPPSAERLAWLTGFTGSAGLAVVLADKAAVWSDGRYVLQLEQQTDGAIWQRLHLTDTPPAEWLAEAAGEGARVGYDPWLVSEDSLARFTERGLDMVPVEPNLVDLVWADRPAPPVARALPHALALAGVPSGEKRTQIGASLAASKQDVAVLTDPASIAWLLNIRGQDVEFTPFALGFALVHADGGVELFMDPAKIPDETRVHFGNGVAVAGRDALPGALSRLQGRRVRLDPAGAPAWFAQRLREAGAVILPGQDPCLLPKALKNASEQAGARASHKRDAVALCRFLHWLTDAAGHETELSIDTQLLAFRSEVEGFAGPSFNTIAGAGEHGAVIHYHATPETDRPVNANEVLLVDSGGQYPDGTTDVTRTIWTGPDAPPAAVRDQFTRVLKGHIALAALVFPEKVTGVQIDALARQFLWQAGLDYDHGTGHGVGSFLSVHEGPVSISTHLRPAALAEGMILSDEPGYYRPGHYGIRLENLLLVQKAPVEGAKPFFAFETLTLAPYDRRLIDTGLLSTQEREWVDHYHARVLAEVGPLLPDEARFWLERVCAPLGSS